MGAWIRALSARSLFRCTMPQLHPVPGPAPARPTADRRALRARSHTVDAETPDGARRRPPWTVRAVQVELGILAALVALGPALIAVLLVSLALISLDGHAGLLTLGLSAAAALGMAVAGSAAAAGVVVLIHHLGRGSRLAWALTLAIALVTAAVAAGAADAVLAPAFVVSPRLCAVVCAAPSVLAALLLLSPPTLRSVLGARRRGMALPTAPTRTVAAS